MSADLLRRAAAKLRRHAEQRQDRRETVVLALLAYRPGGWYVTDLQRHIGGSFGRLYATLWHLERTGRVRAWFVDGPYPRRRMYDVAGGVS